MSNNNTIQLPLRAKHFEGTEFPTGDCAIEKALREMFPDIEIVENVDLTYIGDYVYEHEWYGTSKFNTDASLASAHNFDDTIIRVITLTLTP